MSDEHVTMLLFSKGDGGGTGEASIFVIAAVIVGVVAVVAGVVFVDASGATFNKESLCTSTKSASSS